MTAIHDGDAPARRGAVDDAIRTMRAAAAADGHDDGPGAAGTVDPAVLRTVLATLPHDDQRLLWDRHVVGRELSAIATELGMHARAVLRRLRQAEERLGAAFAAAHARACPPGCLDTRQSLHSYVRHRLSPPRRTVLEAHLFACQGCMRAFVDVREAGWAVRDAGPLLLAGTAAGAAAGAPVVVGALGAGTTGAGAIAWSGPVGAALLAAWEWVRALVLRLGQLGKVGMIGAGTVAGVAVAAVAVALSGGGGGPVAAPPAPGPTSSAVAPAPAPGDTASPDAPPEPEPDETTSAEPPSEGTPAPPATDDPTTTPTSPGSTPTTPPPATQPGTPSSPEPGDPGTEATTPSPTPSGSADPTPTPSTPPTSPSPTPSTSPSPDPTIPEEPDPELVVTTVTRTIRASWHEQRWYHVVVPSSATVVDVRAEDDHVMVLRGVDIGIPQRRWGEPRSYTIEIDVEAPEDVEPDVTLERVPDSDDEAAPSPTPTPSPSAEG